MANNITHTYQLRKQIGEVGYYASIELEVVLQVGSELHITFESDIAEQWRLPIKFGATHFFRYFGRSRREGLQVFVRELNWFPMDTSPMIVAYVTIKCLCEMLNVPDTMIAFDETTGEFRLSK